MKINNPYVGPRTYQRSEANRLFGREKEANDLARLTAIEQVVILYGRGGVGKSSLINTRLIPTLENEGFHVLPIGRVGGDLPVSMSPVDNLFLLNLKITLDQSNRDPGRLVGLKLSNFLEHLTTVDGYHWVYEEAIRSSEELYETTGDSASITSQPFLLIIDQFEEIFSNLKRWNERDEFFVQLGQAIKDYPLFSVVLSLREDYLAELDSYAHLIPGRLRTRYRMEGMKYSAALEAIRRPAELSGLWFAPGVAETLVDNLRRMRFSEQAEEQFSPYVEPVQLQVVCYQLWETLKTGEKDGSVEFTMTDLEQLGDIDSALVDFYEQALHMALALSGGNISERQLRFWFDKQLITEAGTRRKVYRGETETAGIPNAIVELLTQQFLLRSERRAGSYWVELIDDRFVEPIQYVNRVWAERNLNPIAQAVQSWRESAQQPIYLYRDRQLADAFHQLAHDPDQFGEAEREFLRASRQAEDQRKAHRQRIITGSSILLIVILTGLTSWALWNARVAQQGASMAASIHSTAVAAQDEAKRQAHLARSYQLALQADGELRLDRQESALRFMIEAGIITDTVESFIPLQNPIDYSWYRNTSDERIGVIFFANWSPDGKYIVTASEDTTARIWNVETKQELHRLEGHNGAVYQAVWSPNGKRIITIGYDKTVRIWDVDTGQEIHHLEGPAEVFLQVNWSSDSKHIITTSIDGSTHIWGADTGQEIHQLNGHPDVNEIEQ